MKLGRIIYIAFSVLISGMVFLQWNGTSTLAADSRVEKLFDGKTLSGWTIEGPRECWHVHQNRLCCLANKKAKWIRSNEKYHYFVLKFEWKISEGGQSGLLIGFDPEKSSKKEQIRIPIQNQLDDNLHCTGSIDGIASVIKQPDTSPDIWHTMEVHCVKSGVSIFCDGVKNTQFYNSQSTTKLEVPREGYIAFQAINDDSLGQIEFRDIRIKKQEE